MSSQCRSVWGIFATISIYSFNNSSRKTRIQQHSKCLYYISRNKKVAYYPWLIFCTYTTRTYIVLIGYSIYTSPYKNWRWRLYIPYRGKCSFSRVRLVNWSLQNLNLFTFNNRLSFQNRNTRVALRRCSIVFVQKRINVTSSIKVGSRPRCPITSSTYNAQYPLPFSKCILL